MKIMSVCVHILKKKRKIHKNYDIFIPKTYYDWLLEDKQTQQEHQKQQHPVLNTFSINFIKFSILSAIEVDHHTGRVCL